MTGAAGASPPRHAALQHAQALARGAGTRRWPAALARGGVSLAFWAIAKRVAPCARPGGAGAGHCQGIRHWALGIGHLGHIAMRQKSARAWERGA